MYSADQTKVKDAKLLYTVMLSLEGFQGFMSVIYQWHRIIIIIDYYMAFFISHVISTRDSHISPMDNTGRKLIWNIIFFKVQPYFISNNFKNSNMYPKKKIVKN
jgi:hypothetical protein